METFFSDQSYLKGRILWWTGTGDPQAPGSFSICSWKHQIGLWVQVALSIECTVWFILTCDPVVLLCTLRGKSGREVNSKYLINCWDKIVVSADGHCFTLCYASLILVWFLCHSPWCGSFWETAGTMHEHNEEKHRWLWRSDSTDLWFQDQRHWYSMKTLHW
jgi:hypothetical protein